MKTRLPLLAQRSVAEVRSFHREFAENYEVQLRSRVALTCRKGCSNCCYHPVFITLLEGVALYENLHESGIWTRQLKDALHAHADKVRGLAPEVWLMSLIACPLLEDGQCTAYDDRPFSCRVTYSIGNPSNCHPHTLGTSMIPKREAIEAVTPSETEVLRRHHLRHVRLPLSMAVLYGERIATGEVELEDCQRALLEMLPHV